MRRVAARLLAVTAGLAMTAGMASAAGAATGTGTGTRTRTGTAAAAAKLAAPVVRVDQVGYTPRSSKVAFAMLPRPVGSVRFAVVGRRGVVFRGRSPTTPGRGTRTTARCTSSRSRAEPDRAATGSSRLGAAPRGVAAVRDRRAQALYHGLVLNGVRYFTSERDGADRGLGAGPPARQPHRPLRRRLRRPALRQQRQPARHLPPDRRPGQRVRRLVRRGRWLREVRLHGQLRRRAAADSRRGTSPGVPTLAPRPGSG